jgi:hypothetical protein
MSNNRHLHPFYRLFPTLLLDRESEEMMHDEGLLARFWGAWFDSCVTCWEKMASDAVHGTPLVEPMGNILMTMWRPMIRK